MKKIFILHGWTYQTDTWTPFVTLMEKKGFHSTIPPIPGLTEQLDRVWTLSDYVNWLHKKVKDESSFILIAHSNGGRIALAFASQFPKKIKLLILIDSAGIYHKELPIRLKRFLFTKLAKIGKKITTSELLRNFLYKLTRESDYKDASPIMQQTMQNLISCDLTPYLSHIKTKTILIWGRQDKATPLSDGQRIHASIPNSKLYIINNAKHSPQFTHTKEVVRIISNEL